MATATTEPYRTYTPRPFTRAQRDSTTVLFGGLHWRLERLLQAVLENSGHKARILPVATKEDLLTGREVADIGQCCPTSFTTGNLVNFLKKEAKEIGADEVSKHYVYLTAGSCGACRFGQYHQSYELALRNTGLEAFRMFLLAQDQMDQKAAMGDGLDFNLPITFGCLWAIFCTDLVQDLEYQVRPYEVEPGRRTRSCARASTISSRSSKRRPQKAVARHHLAPATPYFARALREVRRKFATIEVDRLRVKPKVKITGEFYLQTVEGDPTTTSTAGSRPRAPRSTRPPSPSGWTTCSGSASSASRTTAGIERGARLKLGAGRAGPGALPVDVRPPAAALGNLPHEIPNQFELRRLAAPYFHSRLDGGEGDMLVGKSLWAHLQQEGPHDLRAVALLLHAEHHEHRRDGRGRRQVPRPPLRAARDQGRRRGARPVALPDDPDRGEEAGAQREFDGALEAHRAHAEEVRAYLEQHPR